MVKVGDRAPDFELPDQNGDLVTLSKFKGNNSLVLFFYPKDNTTGCTKESCSFRDNYAGILGLNAKIIGISRDPPQSHKTFKERHGLPFPLLSDEKGIARRLYGVKRTLFILPGRATFIIDRKGTIRHAILSQFHIQKHVDETMAILTELHEREAQSKNPEHL
jgi:peroxiredoxin Q/BCP